MARYSGKVHETLAANADIPSLVAEMLACLGRARTIKTSDNIDVYRTVWRGRDVVVKWYKHVGPIHSFRYTIKGSRARRAWVNGHRLLELGVRTPRPLAYFDERRGLLLWQSWIVTEYLARPTLHSVLGDKNIPQGRKRRLIHQTLRQVDRLASHGISHGDMKHTNILCDAGRIVLTDLDGMEIHRLAWLRQQRRGRDIARFLRGTGPMGPVDSGRSAGRMQPIPGASGGVQVNSHFRNAELEEALVAGPEVVAERFRAEPVQAGQASRVCRFTAVFNGIRAGVYLKEYLDRSLWDLLKRLVRPSRAMRALNASRMLARHGFCVPETIATGGLQSLSASWPHRTPASFAATLEVAGALSLYNYLIHAPGTPPPCSLREKRDMLRQLGLTIGAMHSKGIVHGDLRPGNVLVRKTDGRWEFFFLDNERTRRSMRLSNRLRLKNLVQINMLPPSVSRADRLRFFQSYLLVNPPVRLRRMWWARKIMGRTDGRLRRKGIRLSPAT